MFTLRRFGGTRDVVARGAGSRPSSGSSKPAIMRSVVVFPQPDGPSIVKNSPSRISVVISLTASTLPNRLRTPSSVMATPSVGIVRV